MKKVMTDPELQAFIVAISRAEIEEHPRVYLKAVRASLHALDYDPDWIESVFRQELESAYANELKDFYCQSEYCSLAADEGPLMEIDNDM